MVVFGGGGFVGSHTVDMLLEHGVGRVTIFGGLGAGALENLASAARDSRVVLVRGTITDVDAVRRVTESADGVFLLSSLWLAECTENPRAALDVNVMGAFNVLDACREHSVKRVVYASSASVYGEPVSVPMTEDHPFHNRTMYGATKIAAEQLCRTFFAMYGLGYLSLRYMNVYGPRMAQKGASMGIPLRVLRAIADGQRPVIFGDGTQSYDFVDVRDVARANVLAMSADAVDEVINIGSGQATSINELTTDLLTITGSKIEPEYRPGAQSIVMQRIGSTELARRLLGFQTQISLKEGLTYLVDWCRRQGMTL